MKVTIKGHIFAKQYIHEKTPNFTFFAFDPPITSGYVFVQDYAIEAELPDTFDIRAGQVAVLEEQRRQLRADFAKSITDIERKISELTAIGCEVQS
jgi:hypothetical protein